MRDLNQTEIHAISGGSFKGVLDAAWWGFVLTAFLGPFPISTSVGQALYPAVANASIRGSLGGATVSASIALAYMGAQALDNYLFPKYPEPIVIAV